MTKYIDLHQFSPIWFLKLHRDPSRCHIHPCMPYEAIGTGHWHSYLLSAFYCAAVGAKSKREEEFFPGMIVSLGRMYLTTYFERGQTADGTQSEDHTAALCPVFPTCAELSGVRSPHCKTRRRKPEILRHGAGKEINTKPRQAAAAAAARTRLG